MLLTISIDIIMALIFQSKEEMSEILKAMNEENDRLVQESRQGRNESVSRHSNYKS